MKAEDLYLQSPVWLQWLLIQWQGKRIARTRLGDDFRRELADFQASDPALPNAGQLRSFVEQAAKTPFWKERFAQYGFNINAGDIMAEIAKLPVITKQEVKDNATSIQNIQAGEKLIWHHTSGTTGSGLVFPQTARMEQQQWAVWWRYRMMHGLQPGTWNGWFGGRSIASVKQQRPPFYRINYPMKQLMFSAHHLKADTVHLYVEQLQKRRITWLHGYPSQISLLASLMKQAGLVRVLPDLKIITTGSENLLETQQNIIAEVLGAPVVQHYGLAEGASNISQHPDGSLRPDQDFAYTEFIPLNEENPELCRIIGTNYHNPAFPLLRYDTGDLARIRWENGVPVVLSIDGRQEDYITLPDGLKLGRLDHIFKKITEVREAQIYQPETGRVVLRIVKNAGYDAAGQEKMLLAETRKRLGNSIHIEIEYLDAIPRTKSGKLRFVISAVGSKQ